MTEVLPNKAVMEFLRSNIVTYKGDQSVKILGGKGDGLTTEPFADSDQPIHDYLTSVNTQAAHCPRYPSGDNDPDPARDSKEFISNSKISEC